MLGGAALPPNEASTPAIGGISNAASGAGGTPYASAQAQARHDAKAKIADSEAVMVHLPSWNAVLSDIASAAAWQAMHIPWHANARGRSWRFLGFEGFYACNAWTPIVSYPQY
jgi:hypothetical protein